MVGSSSAPWRPPTSAGVPFAPFLHLQNPDVPPAQSPAEQLVRLGAALRVRAGEQPLLLVVDDAHLLDPASVLLVHQLVTRREAAVLLAAHVAEPVPDDIGSLVKDGHVHRLELRPLAREHCDEMVASLLGGTIEPSVTDEVWRISEGNPLFVARARGGRRQSGTLVCELGRWSLVSPPGPSPLLRDVIGGRLRDPRRRSTPAPRSARGRRAAASPHRRTAPAPRPRHRALENAGLVRSVRQDEREVISPAHPLHSEVALDLGSATRLQLVRRHVADALDAGSPAPGDLLLRARLRLDAGDTAPQLYLAAALGALQWLDGDFALRCAEAAATDADAVDTHLLRASTRWAWSVATMRQRTRSLH